MSLRNFRPTLAAPCLAALLILAAWSGNARAQSCSGPSDNTVGCIGGFAPGTCTAICSYEIGTTPPELGVWVIEENFIPKHQQPNALALVQAGDKINRFQANARAVLAAKGIAFVDVATVQAAIAAVNAAYAANGNNPIHLLIVGHGTEGYIKVGEDAFDVVDPADQNKFIGAVAGKLINLTLFGCSVAGGADGQKLIHKMAAALGLEEIKAWTRTVAASPTDFWVLRDSKKKLVEAPGADPRLIGLVSLLLLGTGSLFVARWRGKGEIA